MAHVSEFIPNIMCKFGPNCEKDGCTFAHSKNKQICPYENIKDCPRKESCAYIHKDNTMTITGEIKKKPYILCKHHKNRKCVKGEDCTFSHIIYDELCKWGDNCVNKDLCAYTHENKTLNIEDLLNQAYRAGFSQGHIQGYNEGYILGRASGEGVGRASAIIDNKK
jgi:hypothetical protein